MDLYAENILDHYKHPRMQGELPDVTVQHEEKNISCGDTITVTMKVENGTISNLRWTGTGCAISQAAMSMIAEELEGKKTEAIDALTTDDIRALLHVPIGNRRVKCALLCLHTLKNALHTLRNEQMQSWTDTVGNESNAS